MTHEIPQARLEAAWTILQAEGVYILPKRNLVMPKLNLEIVANAVGTRYIKQISVEFRNMNDFLEKVPIADRFGQDHSTRRKWEGEMCRKLGVRVFKEIYESRNQLRLNVLSVPVLAFVNLQQLLEKTHSPDIILDQIKEINGGIDRVFSGYHPVSGIYDSKEYNDRDLDGKLEVVQFMEDRCIDGFALFSK